MTVRFMTAGDGYWSAVETAVEIVDMQVAYINDERDFGELRVYFNTATWNVEHDGLIYTDSDFLNELQLFLVQHGLAGDDVEYSEQGMQGDNYVSLDVGQAFLSSWSAKFNGVVTEEQAAQPAQETKMQKLEMAIALLQDADASMQAALGDTEECFDLHCGIESMVDDLQEVLTRLETA